jgi:hypothetical protein
MCFLLPNNFALSTFKVRPPTPPKKNKTKKPKKKSKVFIKKSHGRKERGGGGLFMGFVDWPIIEVFIPLVIPIFLVTYSKAKYKDFAIIKIFFPHFWLLGGGKKKAQKPLHFLFSNF